MPPMAARKMLQINLKRLQRRRAWRVERPNIPHWRLAEEATVFAVELARAFISDLGRPRWRRPGHPGKKSEGSGYRLCGAGPKLELRGYRGQGQMEIKRCGSQPSSKGPADYFTGAVRVDPLFNPPEPARVRGASVTFEPGARTAWHTHPLGQTLVVTAGCGRAQRWGGPNEDIRPGDVVWFPPGEKHWHGASPTTAMTHIAIQEQLDGKVVEWLEQVSDEQYEGA